MSLARAVSFVLDQETGRLVEGTDAAGPWVSKWGVDSRYHKDLTLDQIRNLQRPAAAILLGGPQYWDAVQGSQWPDYLQLPMLDSAVNEGPKTAIECLQRALYVAADGIVGPQTLKAAASANSTMTLALFTAARVAEYARDPDWATDGDGWVKRAVLAALEAV